MFVDIQGYEEEYMIGECGTVFSKRFNRDLKPSIGTHGYYVINLHKNKKKKLHLVHRLVALSFIEQQIDKKEVDHINRIKTDNNINNLRWVTHSQNNTNRNMNSNNTSGVIGVCKHTTRGINGWAAEIKKDGKRYRKYFPYNDIGLLDATNWVLNKKDELHKYD